MHNWTVDNRNLKLSLVFIDYFSLQTFSNSSPWYMKFKKIRSCFENQNNSSVWGGELIMWFVFFFNSVAVRGVKLH